MKVKTSILVYDHTFRRKILEENSDKQKVAFTRLLLHAGNCTSVISVCGMNTKTGGLSGPFADEKTEASRSLIAFQS